MGDRELDLAKLLARKDALIAAFSEGASLPQAAQGAALAAGGLALVALASGSIGWVAFGAVLVLSLSVLALSTWQRRRHQARFHARIQEILGDIERLKACEGG